MTVFKELYDKDVTEDDFIPFMGTGEANFLGGVANKYGLPFDVATAKAKFFEVYINKYARPGAGIGFKGEQQRRLQACTAGQRVRPAGRVAA